MTRGLDGFAVDPGDPLPASGQLSGAIRSAIDDGSLVPGDRLTPVRRMAVDAGLAPNTVARAYRELEAAGYLEGRGRSGTFVAAAPPSPTDRSLDEAARRYLRRAAHLGADRAAAIDAVRRAAERP